MIPFIFEYFALVNWLRDWHIFSDVAR